MEKVLKKYTIIPPHLYVNRKADNQLNSIITDMQRPGYVLVARQMGKTNLLFNAKRTMENDDRFFGYIDMSNLFQKERECYRYIIDLLIEPNERHLSDDIEYKIKQIRDMELPPHNEYTKSLRVILNDFHGDIVIILDEIDALKATEYSDNIFAQIRSNYFSRTNFPEFERLTYVLSGVIEPIELIKDRNKSPFNIGDKIYLDDFSKAEFLEFIKMSKLNISDEISFEIYNWTNGNPRLTFDICAEVENILLEGIQVDSFRLEKIINDKYLTSYDHAPVDHIRELVNSNKDARNALIGLHEHVNVSVNDNVKKKLYLFGVITSNFNDDIRFKNPIIKKSLSLDWLKSLQKEDDKKKFTLTYGLAFFDSNEFDSAVEVFEYLLETGKDNALLDDIVYFLGRSYYALGQTKRALKHLSHNFKNKTYESGAKCLSGICKLRLGDREGGLIDLESVIDADDFFASSNARLNLARSLENKDSERALELLQSINFSVESDKKNALKIATLYSQFVIYRAQNNKEKAIETLLETLDYSSPSESFAIKLDLYAMNDSYENKVDIVSTVIDNRLIFNEENELNINFNEANFIKCLNFIYDKNNKALFDTLINYAVTNLRIDEQKKYEIIFNAGVLREGNEDLLLELTTHDATINIELSLKLYRHLSILCKHENENFIKFFHKFDKASRSLIELSESDLYVYSQALQILFSSGLFKSVLDICFDLETRMSPQSSDDIIGLASSTIYFWKGAVYANVGDLAMAHSSFKQASLIIKNSKYDSTAYFSKAHFDSIYDYENKIKGSFDIVSPIFIKKVFKNAESQINYTQKQIVKVRYSDGTTKTGKYKKFAMDIKSLKCEVINEK